MRRPTCGQGCITAHDEMCRAGNSIPTRTSVLAGSQPPIGVNSTAIYCLHPPMSETMLAKTDRGTQICDCRETRNMTTCPTQTECSQTVQCILNPRSGSRGHRKSTGTARRQKGARTSPIKPRAQRPGTVPKPANFDEHSGSPGQCNILDPVPLSVLVHTHTTHHTIHI